MKSPADALPPEIARQIDPDWRKNEAAYWAVRDQLLSQYQDQWIGFADGAVVASGSSPVAVFHATEATARSPFVTCVGREDEPVRMRRASFAYDGSYPGEPLPIITLEFRPTSGAPGMILDRVMERLEIPPPPDGSFPRVWQSGKDTFLATQLQSLQ